MAVTLALFDRRFYSVGVMRDLDGRNVDFLMPAVKREPIKRISREHAAAVAAGGRVEAAVDYMSRGKDGEFTHRLVILPRRGHTGSDPAGAYVVFATNMSRRAVLGRIARLPGEYKERWEIETGFRCIKAATGKTRSWSVSVRLILVFFAMMPYNFWIVVRFAGSDGGNAALRGGCITQDGFLRSLLALARSLLCPDRRGLPAAEPGRDGGGG